MKNTSGNFFEKASTKITNWTGSPVAFGVAFLIVIAWILSGSIFNYSDTWQLVINTGTTIITFLMVFLIQKSQNKDSKAIQLKLNELIAASRHASNRMVDIEDLTESELDVLHKYYQKLSDISEADNDIHTSHSIDAAVNLHKIKKEKELFNFQELFDELFIK
ncbi:low affinity iron permease family protein [Pedobacter steynii]